MGHGLGTLADSTMAYPRIITKLLPLPRLDLDGVPLVRDVILLAITGALSAGIDYIAIR